MSLTLGGAGVGPHALAADAVLVPAKDPTDAQMKAKLDAIKAGDFDAYVADGTPRFKGTKHATFNTMSGRLAPMLLKGYKTTFLGEAKTRGGVAHKWRLEPAGRAAEADEVFQIELVPKAGKVDAFSIH